MRRCIVAAIALALLGCSSKEGVQPGDVVRRPEGDVVMIEAGEAEMTKAVAHARSKLDYFIAELQGTKYPTVQFLIKTPLKTGPDIEHIWAYAKRYSAAKGFDGELANTPLDQSKYKLGDQLTISRKDVEDWVINRSATESEGGFTAAVLLKTKKP